TLLYFTACTSAFLLLLAFGPWFTADAQQHRCWAMLVYVSLLWATETFPLHVTALMVPLLVVVLRVMRDPTKNGLPLDSRQSTKAIFAAMFSPVIMLLLGGFTIAAALSKHNIARIIASWVLSKAGTQPRNVLLVSIFVATFASMWISNVAAPVLCFSLIQPILRTLPLGSSYAQCLILGIALASNVGGMASPIASPQNIIAINTMHPSPSWLQWFFVSLPICVVSDMLIWLLLVLVYRPNRSTPNINQIRYTPQRLNPIQIYICVIAGVTILLWCVEAKLQWLFGDMGVIAILPLVLFFCHPAVLTKEDFNNFLWTVIILAMGGIALGAAVESSGLLHVVAGQIDLAVRGMPLFLILCTVCGLILIVCTFISHTVGSLIILPIVAEVGAHLPVPHARLLVMGSALMASGAMGLPVSGFPNMNAVMLEDSMGKRYLTTKDFFRVGIPASIVTYLVIVSIGFVLMYMLGF
ncbi:low-affinity phosphate transporter, partial [Spiromyces aspiralis]